MTGFMASEITTPILGYFLIPFVLHFPRFLSVTAHLLYSSIYQLFRTKHIPQVLPLEQLTTLSTKKTQTKHIQFFCNHQHAIYVNLCPSETSGNPTNDQPTHHLNPSTEYWFIGRIPLRWTKVHDPFQ